MNKGLEDLANGKKRTKVVATLDNGNALLSKQEVETIEKELKRLEEIDNILKDSGLTFDDLKEVCFAYTVLKMDGIDKKLKALEIIKPFLKNIRVVENEKGQYEVLIDVINSEKPLVIARLNNQEEYDLLKEVML